MLQLLYCRAAPTETAEAYRQEYDRWAYQLCPHSSRRIGRPLQWHELCKLHSEPNAIKGRLWRGRYACECPAAVGGHQSRITLKFCMFLHTGVRSSRPNSCLPSVTASLRSLPSGDRGDHVIVAFHLLYSSLFAQQHQYLDRISHFIGTVCLLLPHPSILQTLTDTGQKCFSFSVPHHLTATWLLACSSSLPKCNVLESLLFPVNSGFYLFVLTILCFWRSGTYK